MEFDLLSFVALVLIITVHEYSHASVANLLGDPTAKIAKRISLNPLNHLDPIGTLLMLTAGIGWGKPVPVNPHYFKKPKRDEALTALAGPLSNLFLALLLTLPYKYLGSFLWDPILDFIGRLIEISIILFAFNILPFPPLDGSKFVRFFIPKRYNLQYEKYLRNGFFYFICFLVIDRFIFSSILNFSILGHFIGSIATFIKLIIFLGI